MALYESLHLVPLTVKYRKKKLKTPALIGRLIVNSIEQYPAVIEYVDLHTGEIFSTRMARRAGLKELDFSLCILQREYVFSLLSQDALQFCKFVLGFRNHRGGISPTASKLSKAYASIFNKDRSNTNRLLKQLYERGVLASEQLCKPLFQLHNKSLTRYQHHFAEEALASKAMVL